MKIKTISVWEWADDFQEKVNNWLDENSYKEILDVKYSTTFHIGVGKILFSAIVIYK